MTISNITHRLYQIPGGGISSINYNIPNNVILFGYTPKTGSKPINEEKVKSCGTVKEIIYDDNNGIGKIIFENDVTTIKDYVFDSRKSLTSIFILFIPKFRYIYRN